jgi:hypothetical protein
VDVELDPSIVKPLPHLPGHLPALHVTLQGSIVPAPNADATAAQDAYLLVDLADSHARE